MTKALVERLRSPAISEGLMRNWDMIRGMIAGGDTSSYPRHIFEAIIEVCDEERKEAADRIEKLEAALDAARHESAVHASRADEFLKLLTGILSLMPPPPVAHKGTVAIFKDPDPERTLRLMQDAVRRARAALNGE